MDVNFEDIPKNITHVKIDVGLSYNAPQSQTWLSKESDLVVFGFEPNPDSVACILEGNIKKRATCHGNPLENKYIREKRFFLLPYGLGLEQGYCDFYINQRDCGTSSMFKPKESILGELKEVVKIKVFRLKDFFDVFPWDRFPYIDYLKIDAQGSDLNILKSAEHYLSEKVVYVTAEPDGNQYHGAEFCNNTNIVEYMESIGFVKVNHKLTKDPTFLNQKYSHLKDIYIEQN